MDGNQKLTLNARRAQIFLAPDAEQRQTVEVPLLRKEAVISNIQQFVEAARVSAGETQQQFTDMRVNFAALMLDLCDNVLQLTSAETREALGRDVYNMLMAEGVIDMEWEMSRLTREA